MPMLLRDPTRRMIEKQVFADVSALLLHGNEYAILNRIAQFIIQNHFQIESLTLRTAHFASSRNASDSPEKQQQYDYLASDYHMEFELSDKCLEHIKSIITNKTISSREFVFVIKNADPELNRNLYLALRRLIDINPSSRFIITTTSITFLEKSLVSRCVLLNCLFPLRNITQSTLFRDLGLSPTMEDLSRTYCDCDYNIVSLIQSLASTENHLLWHSSIDKLITTLVKEKNQLVVITEVREHVYKLYHIGVKLPEIASVILRKLPNKLPKKLQQKKHFTGVMNKVVNHIAQCDAMRCQVGNKDILLYERLFLGIYDIF